MDVLDVSLCEGRAHRNETKPFVERRCLDLCVQAERLCLLSFGFVDEKGHECSAQSLTAFDGQHSSDTQYARLGFRKESCIGNDLPVSAKRDMCGKIIDVIQIGVFDILLEIEDIESRLEDFV